MDAEQCGVGAAMLAGTIEILRSNLDSAMFGTTVDEALHLVLEPNAVSLHGPSGTWQGSQDIAELHDFRRRSGYYQRALLSGLDETIRSLREHETAVSGRVFETDRAFVVVYLDRSNALLGLIIFRNIS
jgi:hypothetical protein